LKGGPHKTASAPWRYWQLRQRKSGIHVDLFRFDDYNRGSMMLIRTGPADFSRRFVMVLRDHNMRHDDGYIIEIDSDDTVPCPTEESAFILAGLDYIEPEKRH
jgi:DNA polymerase/3'-5' exonuclease PolX